MAVLTDEVTRDDYTASAGQTVFPYTFYVADEEDLDVYVNGTLQTLTTDYTVSAVQSPTGANVVFVSGLTLNDAVAIVYNPDIERDTDYQTSGSFRSEALNLELSNMISYDQFLKTELNRTVRQNPSEASVTLTLPAATANATLKWNSSANGLENGPTTTDIENAETNATAAAASATAAAATLAQVQTIYDNFDDRYLGVKSSDPALDNDGDALIDGALYYNTTANVMKIYDLGTTSWLTIQSFIVTSLTEETTSVDQNDFMVYAKASDSSQYKITIRNLFAFGIDDISNFGDSPATNDKFAIVNVSNGNANAITYSDLMSFVNLSEETTPADGDFLLGHNGTSPVKIDWNKLPAITPATPATLSGTSQTFTIPSGCKRISIPFSGLSTNGTATPKIQLNDGSYVTSGYLGAAQNANSAATARTDGFWLANSWAGTVIAHGKAELVLVDSTNHIWVCEIHCFNTGTVNVTRGGGSITLSAECDEVRIYMDGVDTFDAGTANCLTEV